MKLTKKYACLRKSTWESHQGNHQVAGKHSFSPNICVELALQDSCTPVLSMRGTCSKHDNLLFSLSNWICIHGWTGENTHPGFCWNEHIFILNSNFVLIAKIIIGFPVYRKNQAMWLAGSSLLQPFVLVLVPPNGRSTAICCGFGTP